MFKDHFRAFTVIITHDSTWHIIFLQCTSSKRGGEFKKMGVWMLPRMQCGNSSI